jgi:selenocysteine lyase/cysteine desulfurase
MSINRRKILKSIGTLGFTALGTPFLSSVFKQDLEALFSQYSSWNARNLTEEEDFWKQIKQAYSVSPTLLNLNNGGVSPQPRVVQEAVEYYNRLSNEAPSYYMWRILDRGREAIRAFLADLAGVDKEEIAINRNSSEALETVIFGLNLKKGDEVVLSKQDYPNMINAWKQRELRDGVVLKWVDLELPSEDIDKMVTAYANQFSRKTKLVHITHVINWNGQILPVAEIAAAAKKRGAKVLVDGAHSFAHLDFKISDLNCDYFGTSLHKWLCAPFGSGMLYVKKENIVSLFPLFAAPDAMVDDIRKFEHLGTRSFAIEQAIGHAVQFHQMIGIERKAHRLHYLKNYWASQASSLDKVSIGSSLKSEFSGAIALLQIEGKDPSEVGRMLESKFRIHTTSIVWENIIGVRVTPNVYTTKRDLDRLLDAIESIVNDI